MTLQGQQHLMTNILVDGKVKRVGVKPAELFATKHEEKQGREGQTMAEAVSLNKAGDVFSLLISVALQQ